MIKAITMRLPGLGAETRNAHKIRLENAKGIDHVGTLEVMGGNIKIEL
jgi:hypothetical protein